MHRMSTSRAMVSSYQGDSKNMELRYSINCMSLDIHNNDHLEEVVRDSRRRYVISHPLSLELRQK